MEDNQTPQVREAETHLEAAMDDARKVFDDGIAETRGSLKTWFSAPAKSFAPWFAAALFIAVTMLLSVWIISTLKEPMLIDIGNLQIQPQVPSVGYVFSKNLIVLALHSFICIAGFLALYAVPNVGKNQGKVSRILHMQVSKGATWFIIAATVFSVTTQVWRLSNITVDVATTYGVSVTSIIASIAPHALIELTAVFLPLAAFIMLSRKDRSKQLLAATVACLTFSFPMLIVASLLEHYLWPEIFGALIN